MTTPPHHPTYGIHVSASQIKQILESALPHTLLISSEPLPHGSSYNNRLYTLAVFHSHSPEISHEHFILKVTGRFWKRAKTLNEAMCLRLLSKHPTLPVPRLVAFSADATSIPNVPFEWILMTKMPGSPIPEKGLGLEDSQSIATDLANFLCGLRGISGPGRIGNLLDVRPDGMAELGGLVDVPTAKRAPYESHLQYQEAVFEAAINLLASEPIYEQNAPLVGVLDDFLKETLPHLDCFGLREGESVNCLTHCDLSRRNILVQRPTPDSPLRLSAVVDWEFSGFFSLYEEFLTADSEIFDLSATATGKSALSVLLLEELAKLGISTPQTNPMKEPWQLVQKLHILRENIAPWWVRDLDPESVEIKTQLNAAQAKIQEILHQFGVSRC